MMKIRRAEKPEILEGKLSSYHGLGKLSHSNHLSP